MFRRRPIARAAMVGGVAYTASKAGAESAAASANENSAAEGPETQQQAAVADPAPAEPSTDESMEELTKLKGLLDEGVLTQAEFDAQKQKILQSM
jgi:membrane protease subunit (stomatin/prohibitin family)